MSPKYLLSSLLSLILVPGALAQTINVIGGPAVANATNTLAQKQSGGNIVTKKPAPPSKPKPPSKGKTPPSKPGPKSSSKNQSTVSNQNQNANSNANANSNTNVAASTATGGAGGTAKAAGGQAVSNAAGGMATGGTSSASGTNTGTNSVNVDASDHGSSNTVSNTNVHVQYIPSVVPDTPPSNLAVGNIVSETGACGPLQRVVKTPIHGTFFGLIKKSNVPQGYTEDLEPYLDEGGQIIEYRKVPYEDGYILYGDQVTQYATILGVAGAKNIALGGGGSAGSWGQGGVGSSSSNQQLVVKIILRECEAGRLRSDNPSVPATVTFQKGSTPTQVIIPVITEAKKIRQ